MRQESGVALQATCLALLAIGVVTFGGCDREGAELLTVLVERGGILRHRRARPGVPVCLHR